VQTRADRSTDKSLLPSSIVFRCTLNNNELHAVASSLLIMQYCLAIASNDRLQLCTQFTDGASALRRDGGIVSKRLNAGRVDNAASQFQTKHVGQEHETTKMNSHQNELPLD